MANNFYYLTNYLFWCPAVFWSLFIITTIKFFGCSLFALVELVGSPNVSTKIILRHQELQTSVVSGFISCFCKIQFAYEATKTAFSGKNLVDIALKQNFLLALWSNKHFLFQSKVFLSTGVKEMKSYDSTWDIFVAYFSC